MSLPSQLSCCREEGDSIGPAAVMQAKYLSFWLPYASLTGEESWQRFIARLVAHGPVNTFVPGSILQTAPGDYVLVGGVAANVEVGVS